MSFEVFGVSFFKTICWCQDITIIPGPPAQAFIVSPQRTLTIRLGQTIRDVSKYQILDKNYDPDIDLAKSTKWAKWAKGNVCKLTSEFVAKIKAEAFDVLLARKRVSGTCAFCVGVLYVRVSRVYVTCVGLLYVRVSRVYVTRTNTCTCMLICCIYIHIYIYIYACIHKYTKKVTGMCAFLCGFIMCMRDHKMYVTKTNTCACMLISCIYIYIYIYIYICIHTNTYTVIHTYTKT
jgi:hypothetical protein